MIFLWFSAGSQKGSLLELPAIVCNLVSLKERHHFIRLRQIWWHSHPKICTGRRIVTHISSSNTILRHDTVEVCGWMRHIQSCGTATSWCRSSNCVCVSIHMCSIRAGDYTTGHWVWTWRAVWSVIEWRHLVLIHCTAGYNSSNIYSWAGKYFNVSLSHVLPVQVCGGRFCTFRWY